MTVVSKEWMLRRPWVRQQIGVIEDCEGRLNVVSLHSTVHAHRSIVLLNIICALVLTQHVIPSMLSVRSIGCNETGIEHTFKNPLYIAPIKGSHVQRCLQ